MVATAPPGIVARNARSPNRTTNVRRCVESLSTIRTLEPSSALRKATVSRLSTPVDDAIRRHGGKNAVRRGGVKPGVLGDLLQGERLGMLRQDLEQPDHALDHLDRILPLLFRGRARHRHCAL